MIDLRKPVHVQDVKIEQESAGYLTCVVELSSGMFMPWCSTKKKVKLMAFPSEVQRVIKTWEGQNETLWQIAHNACKALNH